MKIIVCNIGMLMVLGITTMLGEDTKTKLPATGQGEKTEVVGADLSAAWHEKLAIRVPSGKLQDRIVGKRFVFSGPLVALVKSDNPLQTFNPFAVSNSDSQRDIFRRDPYLPPMRGYTLFRLQF